MLCLRDVVFNNKKNRRRNDTYAEGAGGRSLTTESISKPEFCKFLIESPPYKF